MCLVATVRWRLYQQEQINKQRKQKQLPFYKIYSIKAS